MINSLKEGFKEKRAGAPRKQKLRGFCSRLRLSLGLLETRRQPSVWHGALTAASLEAVRTMVRETRFSAMVGQKPARSRPKDDWYMRE